MTPLTFLFLLTCGGLIFALFKDKHSFVSSETNFSLAVTASADMSTCPIVDLAFQRCNISLILGAVTQ